MFIQIFSSALWQTLAAIVTILTAVSLAVLFFLNPQRSAKEKRYISSIIAVIAVIAVTISGFGVAAFSQSPGQVTSSTPGTTNTPENRTPSQPPSPTAATQIPSTSTPTPYTYSAAQPGPGCDTGGGTWTLQGIGNITCGTRAVPASTGLWSYLSLQLPNNTAFSANNKITITGNSLDSYWISCLGLAEEGAATGFLAQYCADGTWSIDSISNKGTIIQILNHSVTSKRTSTTLSLALDGNTLLFTIDTESYQITVSPVQPTRVAIAYYNPFCGNCSVLANNFNYLTPAATSTSVSVTGTPTASADYSAAQPGPGCDTGGGTWTPQGISGITCSSGTRAVPTTPGIWSYVFLQLPNNAAFAANNKITVTGSNFDGYWISCIGLAEEGASTGFLAEYCPDGSWSIDSISNQGTIIHVLSHNITSRKTTTILSLALDGNTLSFTIDAESHQITVTPIQPVKVALAYYNPFCGNCSVLTNDFSYITPVS